MPAARTETTSRRIPTHDRASDDAPSRDSPRAVEVTGIGTDIPGDRPPAPEENPQGPLRTLFGVVREVVLVLGVALGLSLLIKTLLMQAFFIPSGSMENTLLVGDRVLVSKLTPGPFDLHRGDILVFSDRADWLASEPDQPQSPARHVVQSTLTFVGLLPANSDEHLIKRLIGLPGDTVACCDDQRRMTVNGVSLNEPYLYPGPGGTAQIKFSVTVPAGHIWVQGDHRGNSSDSRYHLDDPGHGMVPIDDVVGRAFVTVWPLNRFHLLHNPAATFAGVPNR